MTRKLIFAFLFSLGAASLCAQDVVIFTGLSEAWMSDMADYRSEFMMRHRVNEKVLQDFPMYWRHGIMMRFRIGSKMKLGFNLATTSTGSRMAYEDHSGRVGLDQALKNYSIGPHFQVRVFEKKRSAIWFYKESGLILTQLKKKEHYQYLDLRGASSTTHSSANVYTEFGMTYEYNYKPDITIYSSIGIQINTAGELSGEFSPSEDTGEFYTTSREADWSGLKIAVGISYRLKRGGKE